MALFTDGLPASLDDLRRYDSSVLDVATAESVDLGAKLELAQRELALEITSFLLRNRYFTGMQRDLRQVIVTEPLLHAHCLQTLECVYRDAFNSQLNERYNAKWNEYRKLSISALARLLELGVGVRRAALQKAAPPICGTVAGLSPESVTLQVAVAWQSHGGSCGAMSDAVATTVPAGSLLSVTAADTQQDAGWHVYLGATPGMLFRQTTEPIKAGDAWTAPDSAIRTDLQTLPEQEPEIFIAETGRLLRG